MPGDKPSGNPACQLLFLEALAQLRPVPVMMMPLMTDPPETMKTPNSDISMECILQEITPFGRRLEGMDTKIPDLAAEFRSIHNDIASFQDRVTNNNYHLSLVEDKLNFSPNRDHKLQYLRDKITDLEDRGQFPLLRDPRMGRRYGYQGLSY
ncbi:hypothetical protein NDU88_002355 [Pleurodeles waltl]|uniref:Uncharacterized protein n=1 Tax=Pleurodeles waltl TaxID=8319 RepID=A0AAV7MNL7_PLEWA|nr:hypothetical protein NDU88_002355 [Pleurodeles waltl]